MITVDDIPTHTKIERVKNGFIIEAWTKQGEHHRSVIEGFEPYGLAVAVLEILGMSIV